MSSHNEVFVWGRAVPALIVATVRVVVEAALRGNNILREAAMWRLVLEVSNTPESATGVAHVLAHGYQSQNLEQRTAGRQLLTKLMQRCPEAVPFVAHAVLCRRATQYSWLQEAMTTALREVKCPQVVRNVTAAFVRASAPRHKGVNDLWKTKLEEFSRECAWPEEVAAILLSEYDSLSKKRQSLFLIPLGELVARCPTNAPQIVEVLLSACKSNSSDMRVVAVGSLCSAMRACPEKALECAEVLLQACSQENNRVRKAAIVQVATAIKLAPPYADEFVCSLKLACGATNRNVRCAALGLLPKAAMLYPLKSNELFDVFAANAFADNFNVMRRQTRHVLGHAFLAWPNHVNQLADLIVEWGSSDLVSKQRVAVESVVISLEACPRAEEMLLEVLFAACNSMVESVRKMAASQLVSVAKACPHMTVELINVLLRLSRNSKTTVKREAVSHLPKAAKLCPEKAQILLEEVLICCHLHDLPLKLTGIRNIAESIEACPEAAEPFLSVLFDACDNRVNKVRAAALHQIGLMAQYCSQHAKDFVSVLLWHCNEDVDKFVRCDALSQLANAAKVSPNRAQEFIETLCSCAEDDDTNEVAREQIIGVLRSFPDLAIKAMEKMLKGRRRSFSTHLNEEKGRRLNRVRSVNDATSLKRKYAEVDVEAIAKPQSDDSLPPPKRTNLRGYNSD